MAEVECRSCSAGIPLGSTRPGEPTAVECAFCGSRFVVEAPTGFETIAYPAALSGRQPGGEPASDPRGKLAIESEVEPATTPAACDLDHFPVTSGTALLIPGQSLRRAVEPREPDTVKRACLVVEGPRGASMPLAGGRTEVGRKSAHIVIADPALSAVHFVVEAIGETFVVRDLGSSNGTRLNGHPIRSARLEPGDTIDAGETRFSFRVAETIPWEGSG